MSRGENFVSPHVRCARLSLYLDNTGCGSASARGENFVSPLAAALAFMYICAVFVVFFERRSGRVRTGG